MLFSTWLTVLTIILQLSIFLDIKSLLLPPTHGRLPLSLLHVSSAELSSEPHYKVDAPQGVGLHSNAAQAAWQLP